MTFRNDLIKNDDVIYKYNELTKVELKVDLLPKDMGLHYIYQPGNDGQSENDDDTLMYDNDSQDDQDDNSDNEELGRITLIMGNRKN